MFLVDFHREFPSKSTIKHYFDCSVRALAYDITHLVVVQRTIIDLCDVLRLALEIGKVTTHDEIDCVINSLVFDGLEKCGFRRLFIELILEGWESRISALSGSI